MWPDSVVIAFPERQDLAGVGELAEAQLIQKFVSQTAVETLDEGILLRLVTLST